MPKCQLSNINAQVIRKIENKPYWEKDFGWDSAGNCVWCGEAGRCKCRHEPFAKPMTTKYLKYMKRKNQKRDLELIESALHPEPKINGYDILHQHKGQWITFSAWKGDSPIRLAFPEFAVHRQDVLGFPYRNDYNEFYKAYKEELTWLTLTEQEILNRK